MGHSLTCARFEVKCYHKGCDLSLVISQILSSFLLKSTTSSRIIKGCAAADENEGRKALLDQQLREIFPDQWPLSNASHENWGEPFLRYLTQIVEEVVVT